jgi:uracil-DNA glycosylase
MTLLTEIERSQQLEQIHARLRSCRLCLDAGYEIYPPAVYHGSIGAKIFLIGQAPGITEQETGRPFNAGSGKRLFAWLAEAGINEDWFRRTQYMAAITRCYPGRAKSGSGDRVASRREQQLCRPYLEAELRLVDPKLILAVGRLAIGLFYPADMPLEEIIGTEKQVDGRWVVPLPHPSGASRWHQTEENRARIRQATGLIRTHYLKFFSGNGRGG